MIRWACFGDLLPKFKNNGLRLWVNLHNLRLRNVHDWGFQSSTQIRFKAKPRKTIIIFFTPFAVLLSSFGLKFIENRRFHAIGHLAHETFYVSALRKSGEISYRYVILLIPRRRCANSAVLDALPQEFKVVGNRFLCVFLRALMYHPKTQIPTWDAMTSIGQPAKVYRYTSYASNTSRFLRLADVSSSKFKDILDRLEIPRNAWIVTLHCREASSWPQFESVHSYRNSSISNFLPAINFILSEGGYVVRIGDPSMTKLPVIRGLVDYAHSKWRSPLYDLLLINNSRFFIASSSGPSAIANLQGTPVAYVNQAPLGVTKGWGPNDISIPKLYRRISTGEYIKFSEIFLSEYANFRKSLQFSESDIYLEENSPDEILETVKELYQKLSSNFFLTEKSNLNLQGQFFKFSQKNNFDYYSSSPISEYFLKKYINLLE
jgi:putative glycosyltransferase (TIGR04372 family)